VTELATPAHKAFTAENRDFVAIVSFVAEIARTLSFIHYKSIFHRDIKPQNLFLLDNHALVGDFGLVELPDLEPITAKGEELGPKHFIAPEMISCGVTSEAGPLMCILWQKRCGCWPPATHPLPGQQRVDEPALTLSAYVSHGQALLLDALLERATSITPSARPTMAAFARHLEEWLKEPTPTTKSVGLSHLTSGLVAALEPGRRVQDRRRECERLATTVLGDS